MTCILGAAGAEDVAFDSCLEELRAWKKVLTQFRLESPLADYNHHEVDRIHGLYKEYIMVLFKIIFYLLQDGCNQLPRPGTRCLRANVCITLGRACDIAVYHYNGYTTWSPVCTATVCWAFVIVATVVVT